MSSFNLGKSAGQSHGNKDATAEVIKMLEENMRHLEEMQEEKIRMRQEHQDEKERLEEQMEQIVDQWMEQKARLEEKMQKEQEEMQKEMDHFRANCNTQVMKEKEDLIKRIEEFQAQRERMDQERAEMIRQMENFRAECEKKMAEEKAQSMAKTIEFQKECELRMEDKEREMTRRMNEFRAESEQKMLDQKVEMSRQTAEFRAESEKLAQEKVELTKQMEDFRIECDRKMAAENELLAKRTTEYQAECERKMAEKEEEIIKEMNNFEAECERKILEEKTSLAQKTEEFRAEQDRMADEKVAMTREMERYREECERKMAEEQETTTRKTAEFQADCARMMQEKEDETTKRMHDFQAEMDAKAKQQKQEMEKLTADHKAETERMTAEKEEMTRQTEEFRLECERSMAEEKAQLMAQMTDFRAEVERLANEKREMTASMEKFREDYERKMQEQRALMEEGMDKVQKEHALKLRENEEEITRKTATFDQEKTRLEKEKESMAAEMSETRSESERLKLEKEELNRNMEAFRIKCDKEMAEEKERMATKTAEFQAECERRMTEQEDEIIKQMSEFEAECDKKIAEEKEQLSRKTMEFKVERERMEKEKEEMTQNMVEFRRESERKMAEEEAEMAKKTNEFRMDCEKMMEEKENEVRQKEAEFRAEFERLGAEKAEMTSKITEFRQECAQQANEKEQLTRELETFRKDCEARMEEKEEEMRRKSAEFKAECDSFAKEKAEMSAQTAAFRAECEKSMALEKEEMTRKTDAFFAECEKTMEANEKEMQRQMNEFREERDRLEQEKREMTQKMDDFRRESERKLAEEEANARQKTKELHEECERTVAREKEAAEKRLEESRKQTEAQLRKEREITDHVMLVLHELPPLQTAMELGDLALLETELKKWSGDSLPGRFGDCKGVVEAVVKLARERWITWRNLEHTWKDVLREVERLPGSLPALTQQSQRVFRALKEAQLTKLDISKSDPEAMTRICTVLETWQARAMSYSNSVQKFILRKVVKWPQLGPFDFADLDICLRLVDRQETSGEVFLSRAKTLVEDPNTEPKEFQPLLSHIETMLFFLKYAMSEDLQSTHQEFRKQAKELDPAVFSFLVWAERQYPPGAELVKFTEGKGLMGGKDVAIVMEELRTPPTSRWSLGSRKDGLGPFREIFYQWALAMQSKFNLLVLPHHTQVVCLLAFQRFLEAASEAKASHTLVAQVGTGEGKSMIVAALAIYVVTALGKKAHVVVDDESLLERDFGTFKRLFDAFTISAAAGSRRALITKICVSEERLAGIPDSVARVDPEADICYCEAKHVQSFYASIARGDADFSIYDNHVLILDEVDALVIDEEPNEAFVYPNEELSEMAASVAMALSRGAPADELHTLTGSHPAGARLVSEMKREWARGQQMIPGEDFAFVKEMGRYCALHAGRTNPKAWSLALECRNYQDGLCSDVLFQERRFVMSRPRVFRKYHRILGLSGSIGSKPERAFLKDTYSAVFFEVPPFLKTCRGSPWHEAVPRALGSGPSGRPQDVFVEPNLEAQLTRLAEVALEARERVPVLIIGKDRAMAEQIVDRLRIAARSRGLGSASDDVVRSLSRTLYEADPEQWKENLNRSTLPLVSGGGAGSKAWRITVTDPRGGRGTDYRVDDQEVDAQGGLLLIPTVIPTSRRDWIQFLGRTARQDRKGQYNCVLCSLDYEVMSKKYQEALPSTGGQATVEQILSWGDRDAAARIKDSAALYNCGVRMNELCEEVYGKRKDLLADGASRERLVDVCQRYRWMSVKEVDEAFARLPGLDPGTIVTEATDLGRPAEPPTRSVVAKGTSGAVTASDGMSRVVSGGGAAPKVVMFCLDWSASMQSRDTRTPLTRFEICIQSFRKILQEQCQDSDLIGIVCFGPNVQVVVPPTPKGQGYSLLEGRIASLKPQQAGGTCFYDAVATCIQQLGQPGLGPDSSSRWLVCLTDGDDLGSRPQNAQGELVTKMLYEGPARLNMIMITVGQLKAQNVKIIDSWVEKVAQTGNVGQHLQQQDAAAIAQAFEVVAECLAAEVGGALEC